MNNYRYFEKLDSTNIYAKEEAKKGAPEYTVIIAGMQSGGYGRMRRKFFSPDSTGLYMSVILRPSLSPEKCLYITTAAAVATAEAIEVLSGKKADIKWVNDIFINGKKVCGILTEAAFSSESSTDYVILGIGVNLSVPKNGFDSSLKDIAGAVFDDRVDPSIRFELADKILEGFKYYYNNLEAKEFLPSYRERCFLMGKTVRIIAGDGEYDARVLDIDDEFGLITETGKGTTTLKSGEVSIKL